MDTAAFAYDLPDEAIAQSPAMPRDSSRLLVDGDPVTDLTTADLPMLVGPGDVIVVNNTRVMAARLNLRKPTGGVAEVLVLEPVGSEDGWWEAMVRPSRRIADGTVLVDAVGAEVIEVGEVTGAGPRLVRSIGRPMVELLATAGSVPLPPYITAPLGDPERYQTVFADRSTSVAAPTAGLHLTPEVLDRCRAAGATLVEVELSVGIGTFRPIEVADLADHRMHEERYRVTPEAWATIQDADRVIAVGTTVVRTLESVAALDQLEGRTDIFITPGYNFVVVDALFTNFHMPRSSLLVMIEAFVGPRWRDLYAHALDEGYRFLSFGDAMFLRRQ